MQKIDYLQTIIFHLNLHHTPYRQDPNLGEDKGGLLGPKKDKYKVCSLLAKAHKKFWVFSWLDSQFCQALRYQNRSRGLVWHYINIDAMSSANDMIIGDCNSSCIPICFMDLKGCASFV